MSLLPEIEDGQIIEQPAPAKPYTPPKRKYGLDLNEDFKADTRYKKLDKPVMADMHECVPNEENECVTCRRDMLV